jgi:hypothetical protein
MRFTKIILQKGFRSIVFALFLFISAYSYGQDVSGTWEGYLSHVSCMNTRQHLKVRLILNREGEAYNGKIAYYYLLSNTSISSQEPIFAFPVSTRLEDRSISINYNASDELNDRFFSIGYYIMGRYSLMLDYKIADGTEKLDGLYRGSNGGKGVLMLHRQEDMPSEPVSNSSVIASLRKKQQDRKAIQQNESPQSETKTLKPVWQQSDSLASLYAEEQKTFQWLKTRTDSVFGIVRLPDTLSYLTIEFFDNAEIDGDSISMFIDDVLVLHKKELSALALPFKLYKPAEGRQLRVRVVAENLGRIPPNTAFVQVTAPSGIKRFFMQSDERSNGVIVFNWMDDN